MPMCSLQYMLVVYVYRNILLLKALEIPLGYYHVCTVHALVFFATHACRVCLPKHLVINTCLSCMLTETSGY